MTFLEIYQQVQYLPRYYQNSEEFGKLSEIYHDFLQQQREQNPEADNNALTALKGNLGDEKFGECTYIADKTKEGFAKQFTLPQPKNIIESFPLENLLPIEVNVDQLNNTNGCIANTDDIQKANELLSDENDIVTVTPQGKEKPLQFIRLEQENYVIYPQHIGAGAYGLVFLMQRTTAPHSWHILKRYRLNDNAPALSHNTTTHQVEPSHIKNENNNLKTVGKDLGMLTKDDYGYLGMQLGLGLTLENLRKQILERKLPTVRFLQIITSTIEAVKANVTDKGLVHLDIKGNNLVIDPITGKCTVIDYGLALNIGVTMDPYERATFLAPELSGDTSYKTNEKSDVYGLGATLLWLFKFISLYPSGFELHEHDPVSSPEDSPLPDEIKGAVKNYLLRMVDKEEPDNRPTFEQALAFFKDLESNYLQASSLFRDIAVIKLTDFKTQDNKIDVTTIKPLLLFDQVWVILPENELATKININQFLHSMMISGINIAGILTAKKAASLSDEIIDAKTYIENNMVPKIDNYFCLAKRDLPANDKAAIKESGISLMPMNTINSNSDYKKLISQTRSRNLINIQQFDTLMASLHEELQRTAEKRAAAKASDNRNTAERLDTRYRTIQTKMKSFSELYKGHRLSHKELHAQLHNLEKRVATMHANPLDYYMHEIFGFGRSTVSAKNIKSVKEDMDKGIVTRKRKATR